MLLKDNRRMLITNKKILDIQNTIYHSKNPTRKRLHQDRFLWIKNSLMYVKKNKKIKTALEIGPGSGIYLPLLRKIASTVTASDIEKVYLENIQLDNSKKNLCLVEDNIEETKFTKNSYDLVLCTEVLEHLKNPEAAIVNISQILKPGGILVLTTPQKYSLMEIFCKIAFLPGIIKLVRLIYQEPVMETGHISLRTEKSLKICFSRSNLSIIKEKKMGLYLPLLAELSDGKAIEKIEKILTNQSIHWPLWTQCYILKKNE
jgi:2-polyprenyl-3-methyl-5-hydroxy-6-metoxy-1,4-benzoquinol methylase